MTHRGPDAAGLWISEDRRVGLAHRRLSIIDLSESAGQPMCTRDGTIWITFNGEIYNHAEIREELTQLGCRDWQTDHSDTEVILYAFRQWGIECLERFNGMFAFALWDARSRELWLVRDRVGIKPLYYSVHHGRITFASEIKALLHDPEQERAVNEEALFHYMTFLTTPAPQTLFNGISKLACGTWVRVSDNGVFHEHRYWDVWDHVTPLKDVDEEEIAERLQEQLRRSVKLRTVSDVPVGGFLSGGIDSSSTVALMSQISPESVKSFTIGYTEEYDSYRNEMPYAHLLATRVGAEYHERLLDVDEVIAFLPSMVKLQDEPIGDPVCVPLYFLSELARGKGVIVCQAGEGADEIFCGYPNWIKWIKYERLNDLPVPRVLKRLGLVGLRALGKESSFHYERLRRVANGEPLFWSGNEMFTDLNKKQILSHRLRHTFNSLKSLEVVRPIRRRFEEKAWEKSHLNWMSYMDLNLVLPEWLLMRADKMSMGVSLEVRVPFLDHKLIEFAMGIPESIRIRNNTEKYILKKAVRGLIPDEIIFRSKQGFGVPIYEWFYGRLGNFAKQELREFCRSSDLFEEASVMQMFDELLSGKLHRSRQCWTLLNLALWHKEFIAPTHYSFLSRSEDRAVDV
jgi:asparagine synthase (glutamine-hydrolysing)